MNTRLNDQNILRKPYDKAGKTAHGLGYPQTTSYSLEGDARADLKLDRMDYH